MDSEYNEIETQSKNVQIKPYGNSKLIGLMIDPFHRFIKKNVPGREGS